MPPVLVPPVLARNAREAWGADGHRWLAELPAVAAAVSGDWQLELGEQFELSYHWVARAIRADGSPAVLKLGVPQAGHLTVEAAALRLFAGHGAVRLLEYDAGRGALLLELADPGTPLRTLVPERDEEATAILIDVMRRVHRPVPADCPLPELVDRERDSFSGYLRTHPADSPLPRDLVQRAGRLFEELCASATERVVLHGDLHHDNVLRSRREPWLAIDPHGVVGDRGYEVGAMLYNPDPPVRDERLLALVRARSEQLAHGLALPLDRVVAWGFVQAVLSEVWTASGGGTTGGRPLDVALALRPRLP